MFGRSKPQISLDEIEIFCVGGRETRRFGLGRWYLPVLAVRKATGEVIVTSIECRNFDFTDNISEENIYSRGSSKFIKNYKPFVEHDRLPENPEYLEVPKLSRQNK